jgi:hypothetical protein
LINPLTEDWDDEMVHAIFWEEDAQKILTIPVHLEMDDILAWHYDPKGIFSVKSAYRVFCDDQNRRSKNDWAASSSSNGDDAEKVWSLIWNMQALSRLEHFLWRLSHNSLALRLNLKHRGVQVEDDRCIMCSKQGEDGAHLFLKCKQVRELWRRMGLEQIRLAMVNCGTTREAIQKLLTTGDELQLKGSFLLNNWWQERNQIREGKRRRSLDDIANLSGRQAIEISKLQRTIQSVPKIQAIRRRWEKPPTGLLKVNVDGAFRDLDKNGGWRYVIRDERGVVIQSSLGRITNAANSLYTELMACLEGAKVVLSMGASRFILETDANMWSGQCKGTILGWLWWVASSMNSKLF